MKDSDHSELKRIIKGCMNGRRAQQKELYQSFYSYAMNICVLYAESREDAVEIMNDGFMKIFKYIGKFDLSRPFVPWLRRIMINAAIDRTRKDFRFNEMKDLEEAESAESADTVISGISHEEILGILKNLSPAYRTVFNLYAIEGYKHEEIARQLGISVGTSKSNYAKARKRLQEQLKNFFESENV
ncbi:MAG: sigma-70 family RNA polymerase sigma factor [Imperialibacter sp.]|uniref:RNA polymerase sigma factor n=1 Tax=Imperialibacter sp. TaxID=2038411 RepID=UPI0032EBF7E3